MVSGIYNPSRDRLGSLRFIKSDEFDNRFKL